MGLSESMLPRAMLPAACGAKSMYDVIMSIQTEQLIRRIWTAHASSGIMPFRSVRFADGTSPQPNRCEHNVMRWTDENPADEAVPAWLATGLLVQKHWVVKPRRAAIEHHSAAIGHADLRASRTDFRVQTAERGDPPGAFSASTAGILSGASSEPQDPTALPPSKGAETTQSGSID